MIKVTNLSKTFYTEQGEVKAVKDCSFEVPTGAFLTLLGPSGCGKTTILRCIAGLEKADSGEIIIQDNVVFSSKTGASVPAYKRGIGMVFQSYAIWPHMDVAGNVMFPLVVQKNAFSPSTKREMVKKALELVKLGGLEKRPAPQLSGGQQQRLALARALVAEPQLLLLDEPLSNLDARLREEMRLELRELQSRLKLTTVYVTHDQLEALAMSDTVIVMSEGRIMETSSPRAIYEKPSNKFTADFVGLANAFEGVVLSTGAGALGEVKTVLGTLHCLLPDGTTKGDKVAVYIRPESISLHKERPSSDINVLEGTVATAVFLGEYSDCDISVGEQRLRTKIPASIVVTIGDHVFLSLHTEKCLVLPVND